ncbi:hypothetical protein F4805DRAFT_437136 [Annulohypoxylon moriforme]|nr:hypothetical protein F4805DRAFT_437136 [Annulohypoxylon moriforme]
MSDFTISLPSSQEGVNGNAAINLAIANPNEVSAGPAPFAAGGGYLTFAPSAANCTASGKNKASAMNFTCTETTESSYGVWAVSLQDGGAGAGGAIDPSSMSLQFTLTYNVTRWGAVWYKVYEGSARLTTDANLILGKCQNPDNHCSYTLNPDKTPLFVTPAMTDCKGTCSNNP